MAAQYTGYFNLDSFTAVEGTTKVCTAVDTSTIEGFDGDLNIDMISISRYDSTSGRFKSVIVHYEVDASGILYIYSDEKFNGKVTINRDSTI